MAKKQAAFPTPEDIASFYSGGNMVGRIAYDWTNSNGTTGAGATGTIRLNPSLLASRDAFLKGIRSKKYDQRRSAVILGMPWLSTLLHESLHNRANQGDFDNSNEIMEGDLGVRLVPDALQRFFGVKMDSKLGQEVTDMVLRNLRR